jgi:ubiquinone/menaquinone biosynthesis C-methylase UbiE
MPELDPSKNAHWQLEHRKHTKKDRYASYAQLKDLLHSNLSPERCDKILHLGCGTSSVQEGLWRDGWANITNVDFCPELVSRLQRQHSHMDGMQYQCGDVTADALAGFPDEAFDFSKCGWFVN